MSRRCRECNSSLSDGDLFCPKCGTKVREMCKQCGNVVADGDVFCSQCGAPLRDLEGVPEGAVIHAAKSVAHRLNNALSIMLTSSQLAINQMPDLSADTCRRLQGYLQDIAAAAMESGAVIHRFQKFLNCLTDKSSPKADSAYADLLASVEIGKEAGDVPIAVKPAQHSTLKKKTGGTQITSGSGSRVLDASLKEKKAPTTSERVAHTSILIVDDEDKIRHALSYALTLDGHHVITASDGSEALTLFHKGSYDIVFVDLKMPGMDGWAVARSIKQTEPKTKVVLMTGLRVELSDEELKESHADAVISKPFELSDVTDLIAAFMNGDP